MKEYEFIHNGHAYTYTLDGYKVMEVWDYMGGDIDYDTEEGMEVFQAAQDDSIHQYAGRREYDNQISEF